MECLKLFRSESFFVMLSNLTGLTLHELVVGNNSDSENEAEVQFLTESSESEAEDEGHPEVNQNDILANTKSGDSENDSDSQLFEATKAKKRKFTYSSDAPVGGSTSADADDNKKVSQTSEFFFFCCYDHIRSIEM